MARLHLLSDPFIQLSAIDTQIGQGGSAALLSLLNASDELTLDLALYQVVDSLGLVRPEIEKSVPVAGKLAIQEPGRAVTCLGKTSCPWLMGYLQDARVGCPPS